MNIVTILFLCGLVQAIPSRPSQSPFFEVRNGVLVSIAKESAASDTSSYGRIVGGENAEPGSAPWMASLQWGIVRPAHFCGGTIINPNWVLTGKSYFCLVVVRLCGFSFFVSFFVQNSAAHCILAYQDFGISTVIAGLHDLSEFSTSEQIRHVTRSNTWVHEEYDGFLGPHDIGLLVFQTPFTFDALVSAIPLPQADRIHSGIATLHGWGSVSDSFYPSYPTILQFTNMPIIPLQTCRLTWNYNPDPIHDNHLCAGSLDGGAGGCSLDSGGALTQNGEAVGIFSWGTFPCGTPQRPSIYVRISAYVSWIQDIIDNN